MDAPTQALLGRMWQDFADFPADPTVADRRASLRRMADLYGPPLAEIALYEERWIAGGLRVRIYRPLNVTAAVPVLLHLHGGGWVLGDPETYERVCRAYCAAGGCIVVDVDYRLAPEHPYPAGLIDSETALRWVAENAASFGGDATRIAVTGDSAGGALAAALCQRTDIPVALLVLVYPMLTVQPGAETPSRIALGDGRFFLGTADIRRAEREYLADPVDGSSAGASPLLATELTGHPPSLIVTAGLDPLRDEAEQYADRLCAAGVDVAYECVPNTIHAFVLFGGAISAGAAAIARIGERLRRL